MDAALLTLVQEDRDGDGGEDADDDDDDEELDEGEALLLLGLADASEHCDFLRVVVVIAVPDGGVRPGSWADPSRPPGFAAPPCDGCAFFWSSLLRPRSLSAIRRDYLNPSG